MVAQTKKRKRRRSGPIHTKTRQKKPQHLAESEPPRKFSHGRAWMYEKRVCWPACFDCYEAARKQRKRTVYRRETGQQGRRVDPTKTRETIRTLVDRCGYSIAEIARETGVHQNTVRRMYLQDTEVQYTISTFADAIDDLFARRQPRGSARYKNLIDPGPARAAVRGLMRQGWNQRWISENTGISVSGISQIASINGTSFIKPENSAALVELARRTGSAEGPHNHSRSYAKSMGWKKTIMYDELL